MSKKTNKTSKARRSPPLLWGADPKVCKANPGVIPTKTSFEKGACAV